MDSALLFVWVACLGLIKALEIPSAENFILSREGCSIVLTCAGESTIQPEWRKRGGAGNNELDNAQTKVTKVTRGNTATWHSSLIFQSLTVGDGGQYWCDVHPESSSVSSNTIMSVMPGKMDISISQSVVNGRTILQCRVETCLQDVAVQFFTGSKLLKSTTEPVSRGWLGTAQVEPNANNVGDYVCQAMSDAANLVLRRSITLS